MLSDKIRGLRKKSGLSQEEFAERLDVSRQAVSKWETGAAVPNLDKLVEIADFFEVSLDFLMRENSEKPCATKTEVLETDGKFSENEAAPQRRITRKRTAAILLLSAAVILGAVLVVLYATGSASGFTGGSGITINGTGLLATLAILLGAAGAVTLILSIKK